MPASQVFSGSGNPNGVVDGNPGDVYQDQTGNFWINIAAPSTWTALGAAGLIGDGGATPFAPVGGPYRPLGNLFVMDDFNNRAFTNCVNVHSALHTLSEFFARGPFNDMLGVCRVQLVGAVAGEFNSITQFITTNNSLPVLSLNNQSRCWMATRLSFENAPFPTGGDQVIIGFASQVDLSGGTPGSGAWFQMNAAGSAFECAWSISDDTGIVSGTFDTGIAPRPARRGNNLLVDIVSGPNGSVTWSIEGVIVHGPIALVNPNELLTNVVGNFASAGSQSNSIHLDYMMTNIELNRANA
jgi:hypothetical protein